MTGLINWTTIIVHYNPQRWKLRSLIIRNFTSTCTVQYMPTSPNIHAISWHQRSVAASAVRSTPDTPSRATTTARHTCLCRLPLPSEPCGQTACGLHQPLGHLISQTCRTCPPYNVYAQGATFPCARTVPMKRCALLAPLDHTPPTLPAQVRSVVVTTTTTSLSLSAPATFQCGHGTFNFKDSPSTLHPSRRSPSNQFAASATRAASAQAGRRPRLTYR